MDKKTKARAKTALNNTDEMLETNVGYLLLRVVLWLGKTGSIEEEDYSLPIVSLFGKDYYVSTP